MLKLPGSPRASRRTHASVRGWRNSTLGLLVVYRVRADGVTYYLRVAEEAGEDLTTDAQVLARLAGLGVRVPVVVHVEAGPGDLDRSFLIVAALAGESLASHGTDTSVTRTTRPHRPLLSLDGAPRA